MRWGEPLGLYDVAALDAVIREAMRSDVVRQGSLLAGVGVVIGIGLALAVSRTLSIFLFGVSPFDPLTFSAVAIFLLGSGVAPSYFPARRFQDAWRLR